MNSVISSLLVLFSIFFQSCAIDDQNKQTKGRLNIVFIYADDWGFGDLSCPESTFCESPNLEKMVAEGTSFENFKTNNRLDKV